MLLTPACLSHNTPFSPLRHLTLTRRYRLAHQLCVFPCDKIVIYSNCNKKKKPQSVSLSAQPLSRTDREVRQYSLATLSRAPSSCWLSEGEFTQNGKESRFIDQSKCAAAKDCNNMKEHNMPLRCSATFQAKHPLRWFSHDCNSPEMREFTSLSS